MESFDKWLAFYSAKFERVSNDTLKGYWYLYGRDSDSDGHPRELAAWSAVNAAMQERRL